MIVEELRMRKKNLKLTTRELAILADLPQGTVSKIMTGETRNPSYITIEKLTDAIEKQEMLVRLRAYQEAMHQYFAEHPEDAGDQEKFERIYRETNHLEDRVPIPFAIPKPDEVLSDGNLALHDDRMTVSELSKLGEHREYELINGSLIVAEMAGVRHQRMVRKIGKFISEFVESKHGDCEVFDVGVNVYLDEDDYTLVIPDIAVVCDPSRICEKGIIGAPDWIIEVVSASTRQTDYHKKLHKYMDAGVREYWIVDMDRSMVSVCVNGEPMQITIYGIHEEIPVNIYGGELRICLIN